MTDMPQPVPRYSNYSIVLVKGERIMWTVLLIGAITLIGVGIWDVVESEAVLGGAQILTGLVWGVFPRLRRVWWGMGWNRGAYAALDRAEESRLRGLDLREYVEAETERLLINLGRRY